MCVATSVSAMESTDRRVSCNSSQSAVPEKCLPPVLLDALTGLVEIEACREVDVIVTILADELHTV